MSSFTKKLPPFGKQFQPVPRNGVQVAIGPGAWDFQKKHSSPIMVLPDDANPDDFTWPHDGNSGLIHERGIYDDESELLHALQLRRNPGVAARLLADCSLGQIIQNGSVRP